jgi:hypothetical protein
MTFCFSIVMNLYENGRVASRKKASMINSTNISLIALSISGIVAVIGIINFFYNWFYKHKPNIQVLNDNEQIKALALSYEKLPQDTRNRFHDSTEKNPNYAIFALVLANSGLGAGFVRIKQMQVTPDYIHASRFNYIAVPPRDIITHQLLIRNVPEIPEGQSLAVSVILDLEWGGANSRKGIVMKTEKTCKLDVVIHAGFYR